MGHTASQQEDNRWKLVVLLYGVYMYRLRVFCGRSSLIPSHSPIQFVVYVSGHYKLTKVMNVSVNHSVSSHVAPLMDGANFTSGDVVCTPPSPARVGSSSACGPEED